MFRTNNAYISDGKVLYAEQVDENTRVLTLMKGGASVYKKTLKNSGYVSTKEELIGFSCHTAVTKDGIYVFKEDEIIERPILD